MSAGEIIAIVPMKPLQRAKTRLADALTPSERAAVSLGMLRRVIAAAQASSLSGVWVIGGDVVVRQAAERAGAKWRKDCGGNLNESIEIAMRQAFKCGNAALYLPADLPFVTACDVNALLDASRNGAALAFAPAKRDGGTNAMLVPYGSPFRPALGKRSFCRHKAQAQRLSIAFAVCESDGFGIDLDTPADLAVCAAAEPGFVDNLTTLAGLDEVDL